MMCGHGKDTSYKALHAPCTCLSTQPCPLKLWQRLGPTTEPSILDPHPNPKRYASDPEPLDL